MDDEGGQSRQMFAGSAPTPLVQNHPLTDILAGDIADKVATPVRHRDKGRVDVLQQIEDILQWIG
jgi:hypothetical protein